MKLEKIVLVDVMPKGMWNPGLYSRHSAFDPISIEYIGAVAQKEGYEVKIIQQRDEDKNQLLDKILTEEPDLVGYSTMTYGFPFGKELAEKVKGSKKDVINVFGGYHISALPQEIDGKIINFGVLGEGEYGFLELLNSLRDGKEFEEIEGIVFRDVKNNLIITNPRERIDDLDELPFPIRLKEYLEGNWIESGIWPPPSQQKAVAQITYSRGCPHKCSYCASPKIWGPKVRHRSAKNLVGEIEYLQKEFGTNYLFFTDLTFNLRKDKVHELCNEIKERKIEIYWYAMCRPDADEKLLREMKDAGCTRIAWGIEALSDSTLGDILRHYNTQEAMKTIKIADSLGITTRAFIVLGWPQEEENYTNSKEFVNKSLSVLKEYAKNGLDGIRVSFLTPLPGTKLYDECEEKNLFLIKDFSKYSTDEVPIMKLNKLSSAELVKARQMIFRGFYESKEYSQHIKDKVKRFPPLKESFKEFFWLLKTRGNISVKI